MVTLDNAKLHLRIDTDRENIAVTYYLARARAIAADFIGVDVAEVDTFGGDVDPAILLILGELYARRGDPLSAHVIELLTPYRKPAVA